VCIELNIKNYSCCFVLLFGVSLHLQLVASTSEDLPYESLYQQFKNSPLVPKEMRDVLPNKIIGDVSDYRTEISVRDGYRWVSVKFRYPPDGTKSDNNPIEDKLKEIYPHLWTGYAREIIVSDRTRVIFYGLVGNSVIEYYSSYRIE